MNESNKHVADENSQFFTDNHNNFSSMESPNHQQTNLYGIFSAESQFSTISQLSTGSQHITTTTSVTTPTHLQCGYNNNNINNNNNSMSFSYLPSHDTSILSNNNNSNITNISDIVTPVSDIISTSILTHNSQYSFTSHKLWNQNILNSPTPYNKNVFNKIKYYIHQINNHNNTQSNNCQINFLSNLNSLDTEGVIYAIINLIYSINISSTNHFIILSYGL